MQKLKRKNKRYINGKLKMFLGFFLVIGIVCLAFIPNVCFADDLQAVQEKVISDVNLVNNLISTVCSFLLWPVLTIAGIAMDNSLVYGKFLNLDAPLWTLWNIMKNFANFALGFMFLFSIVKNMLSPVGVKSDPTKVVKNTLVAGILIQMSRFLVAALIDLSTILIYAIGGLPLSLLDFDSNSDVSQPIMTYNIKMSQGSTGVSSYIYGSYGNHNISKCILTKDLPGLTGQYIIGREYLYFDTGVAFDPGYCLLGGSPYKYNEIGTNVYDPNGYIESAQSFDDKNITYKNALTSYLTNLNESSLTPLINSCSISSISQIPQDCVSNGYGIISYSDPFFAEATSSSTNIKMTVNNLLEKSKGMVGPLVTMYSSLLGYQNFVMNYGASGDGVIESSFNTLISSFFALVLFLPVVILMVVLYIRIGMLRVIIALSPIIILLYVYGTLDKVEFLKKFKPSEIFKIIFSPVIVVFVINLSIVFLSAIRSARPDKPIQTNPDGSSLVAIEADESSNLLNSFGITKLGCDPVGEGNIQQNGGDNCTYSILGVVKIKLNISRIDYGMDMFSWLIIMLLSTGIVRFFMKFALEAMGDTLMGKDTFGGKLLGNASELLTNIPIVPIPGGNGAVGWNSIKSVSGELISRPLAEIENKQRSALEDRFPWLVGTKKKDSNPGVESVIEKINTAISDNKNPSEILESLDKTEKEKLQTFYYPSGNVSADDIVNNIYNYYSNVDNRQIIDTGKSLSDSSHTTADAAMFTAQQINAAINWDMRWKSWADSMARGTVHTRDGIYVVQDHGSAGNPFYELVEYTDETARSLENLKNESWVQDDQNKKEFTKLKKLYEAIKDDLGKYKELSEKESNGSISDNERKLLDLLKKYGSIDDLTKILDGIILNNG